MIKISQKYEFCMCTCTFFKIGARSEYRVRDGESGHVAVCIKMHKHANKAAGVIRPTVVLLHNCVIHTE
jgi:hypothetical protein